MAKKTQTTDELDDNESSPKIYSRDFLREFIVLYRNHSCLWHIKSKDYRDKYLRNRAYDVLVKKMKEVNPTANRKTVVRRINILRTAFRREYKKVRFSERKYPLAKYKSPLWYYDLLKFVAEQNKQQSDNQNIYLDQDVNDEVNTASTELNRFHEEISIKCNIGKIEPPSPTSSPNPLSQTAFLQTKDSYERESFSETLIPHQFRGTDQDEFQIFGNYVATKLRTSTQRQSVIAEKIIADVLHRAALGTLEENTCLSENLPQRYIMVEKIQSS